jgi:hypothetical protein
MVAAGPCWVGAASNSKQQQATQATASNNKQEWLQRGHVWFQQQAAASNSRQEQAGMVAVGPCFIAAASTSKQEPAEKLQ